MNFYQEMEYPNTNLYLWETLLNYLINSTKKYISFMCSFHIKYVWDWTVPDVVIVVTAHLLKRVNNIIHFHSCQHVDHEYNCSSPE